MKPSHRDIFTEEAKRLVAEARHAVEERVKRKKELEGLDTPEAKLELAWIEHRDAMGDSTQHLGAIERALQQRAEYREREREREEHAKKTFDAVVLEVQKSPKVKELYQEFGAFRGKDAAREMALLQSRLIDTEVRKIVKYLGSPDDSHALLVVLNSQASYRNVKQEIARRLL